jgi:hypothetical protein
VKGREGRGIWAGRASWAGRRVGRRRELGLRRTGPRGKKKRGRGRPLGWKEGRKGKESLGFFLFFPTILNHFSKPFKNQTLYTNFCKLSQTFFTIIFKDF